MKKIIFFTFFLIVACSTESKTDSYNKSDCKDARLVDSLDYDSTQYLFDCGLNDKVINIIKNNGSITDGTGVAIILLKYDYVDDAVKLFKKSAKIGDGEAFHYLGLIYEYNEEYKNLDKAVEYYLEGVNHSFNHSYYALANIYLYREGYVNYSRAKFYLDNAVDKKVHGSFSLMGHYYLINSNFEKAKHYFNGSINSGDLINGYYGFLTMYSYYPSDKDHNSDEAYEYLNKILDVQTNNENEENSKYKIAAQFYMDDKKYYDLKKSEYYKKKAEKYSVYN